MSLAFPIVNENEIAIKAKEENERKWKTKAGFDYIMKRENWNEHPKRPDPSTIEQLKNPYHEQVLETKRRMKGFAYNPKDHGKPDFQGKIRLRRATFGDAEYFKTVFISGDDMVAEELEMKRKAEEDWEK